MWNTFILLHQFYQSDLFQVRRWDKKERAYTELNCPAVIATYNKGMGGVDRCDQLLAFPRCLLETCNTLYWIIDGDRI